MSNNPHYLAEENDYKILDGNVVYIENEYIKFGINIALGGTTVMILVGVAIDTVRELESQMMMRHYKGFLE